MARTQKKRKILYYSGTSTHPFFIEEFKNMPPEIAFIPSNPKFFSNDTSTTRHSPTMKFSRFFEMLRDILLKLVLWIGIPKVSFVKTDADLIYSSGYLIFRKKYIVTFEDASVFFYHKIHRWNFFLTKFFVRVLLESKNCLQIIPWTNAAKKSLISIFGNNRKILGKTQVIYPSIVQKSRHFKRGFPKNILFIGHEFLLKGGYETFLAFKSLNPNAILHFVSLKIPKSIEREMRAISKVKIYKNLTNQEIQKLYQQADLYVMPTHLDTLGFTFFEAMSYGIPCIATINFSSSELIDNNEDGYLIPNYCSLFDERYLHCYEDFSKLNMQLLNPPQEFINNLAEKMGLLLTNEDLREEFGKKAYEKVKSGKISVKRKQDIIRELMGRINT